MDRRRHRQTGPSTGRYGEEDGSSFRFGQTVVSEAGNAELEAILELILPEKDNFRLENIPEPKLTAEEAHLPPAQRLRRITIKKCEQVNCYNFYSLEYLINLLSRSDRKSTDKYNDAVGSHLMGPEDFYINWVSDLDKINLLTNWITAEIMEQQIREPSRRPEIPDMKAGTMVSAFFNATGHYHRAKVVNVCSDSNTATVFFVDNGLTEIIGTERIRSLPQALLSLPPYAIRCKLDRVHFSEENLADEETRNEFIWELEEHSPFKCKLTSSEDPNNIRFVKIKFVQGFPKPRPLNAVIQWKYNARDQVNRSLANAYKEKMHDVQTSLVLSSKEVEIPNFSTFRMKGLRLLRIHAVNSPVDFSVEYILDHTGPQWMALWQRNLQTVYDDDTQRLNYRLKTCRPLLRRCYVAKTHFNGWQRCRILDRQDEHNTCGIILLDLGFKITVSFSAVHEIDVQLTHMCALGFRAYLMNIVPPGGASDWSTEICRTFEQMVKGKVFRSLVMERKEAPTDSTCPQIESPLGLIMLETEDPSVNVLDKMVLNAQLCEMNLADLDGIAAQAPFLNSNEECHFDFQQMKKIIGSENPSLDVQELVYDFKEDLPVITTVKPAGCTSNSSASSALSDKLMQCYRQFTPQLPENVRQIPSEIRQSLASCFVSYVASPSCFYIQMVGKIPKMKQMTRYIGKQLDSEPQIPPASIVPGLEVAVYLYDSSDNPTWFRGIVRVVFSEIKLCRLILVDYGNEVSVKFCAVRLLPHYYCGIPGFAQRVHLDVVNLVPTGGMPNSPRWSTQACELFRRYLSSWQPENPVYYIWRPPRSAVIDLDSHGQEMEYKPKESTWVKQPKQTLTQADLLPSVINTAKPMAKKLLRSIGVDLMYEVLTQESDPYKFENAWEVLVKKGFAQNRNPK